MVKFRYALRQEGWLAVRFVPWAHESTQLGEEFVLAAGHNFPNFERLNVSYEYWEYGVGFETPRFSARHGGLRPWGEDGYYTDRNLHSFPRQLSTSHSNFEPSFGFEYRHPHHGDRAWAPFGSIDWRHRIIYNYEKPSSDTPEHKQWSTGLTAGVRTASAAATPAAFALSHFYLRLYYGINPHGQLRNQRNYTMFGVGLNFRVN